MNTSFYLVSQQLTGASRAEGAVIHVTDAETEAQRADFTKATKEGTEGASVPLIANQGLRAWDEGRERLWTHPGLIPHL